MAKKAKRIDLKDILPPLAAQEFSALKADIKENGVRVPIDVDEDGNILDGRHRFKIDKNAPRRVVKGLTAAEKEAFVFRANFVRRNLSPEAKREALKRMRETASKLRAEDARKWTQARVAAALGVARETVRNWFMPNGQKAKAHKPKPDARVKLSKEAKDEIAKRVRAGESQAQIAADYGISQSQVSRIAAAEEKKRAEAAVDLKARRSARKAAPEGHCTLLEGDFRKIEIAAESVDWIVTDPPYEKEAIGLYAGLRDFALKVLRPGGGLLVMTGQSYLPEVFSCLLGCGLTYQWTLAYLTPGGQSSQLWRQKINTFWKPVLWYAKGKHAGGWAGDVVKSAVNDNDKRYHQWGQSESGLGDLLNRFTKKGDLICDPFMGGGTTGLAALKGGRRFFGIELNQRSFRVAKRRLDGV